MTLTVNPSDNVAENQSVALQCESNPNPPTPIVVSFIIRLPPINPVCVRWSQAMEFVKKHQILVGSRITPPVQTIHCTEFTWLYPGTGMGRLFSVKHAIIGATVSSSP